MDLYDYEYKAPLTNRDRSKRNSSRSYYCLCDLTAVWEGQKCDICGRRIGPKAKMKPGKFKED